MASRSVMCPTTAPSTGCRSRRRRGRCRSSMAIPFVGSHPGRASGISAGCGGQPLPAAMWGLSLGWNAIFSELSVDDLGKVSESGVSRVTGGLSFRPGRCTGHAEVGDRRRAGAELACGLKLLLGGSEAGLESGDFAEPAFAVGFGDAVVEVVADLDQALCLSRVGSKQRTSDATVLMQARRSEVAGAG